MALSLRGGVIAAPSMFAASARRPFTHAGLFLLCLANLSFEVLLTRIFSVTMWYHFAFFAISVSLFGMTVGAMVVFMRPRDFTEERAPSQLAAAALGFAIAIVLSVVMHFLVPVVFVPSLLGLGTILFTYLTFAVPFFFAGLAVCIALTKFPEHVSTLYAADLTGAASGCLALIALLRVADASAAVVTIAIGVLAAGALFVAEAPLTRFAKATFFVSIGGLAAVLASLPMPVGELDSGLVQANQRGESTPYVRWNSFSRIRVTGDPDRLMPPFAWAMSPAYPRRSEPMARQLTLAIDAMAGSVLTGFDGNLEAVEYLKYDLVNLAHYLRSGAAVLAVGVGGGRDILAALAFGQPRVVGVEINEDIIKTVNRRFGDFTGHLDRYPQVAFVNDDARSYLARERERFDIIQIAMIDTWAATAAGAFALTENSLYTVEAWTLFLERLTANGVLTVSRWYFGDRPGELYRLTALAAASLKAWGVADPRDHIIVVINAGEPSNRIGTMLLSAAPFSARDLDQLDQVVARLRFEVVLSPRLSSDETLAALATGDDPRMLATNFPINLTPPTDDAPFFFQMLRLSSVLDPASWELGRNSFNLKAVVILCLVLAVVAVLTLLSIVVPLSLAGRRAIPSRAVPFLVFFACIGMGFMLIEVALMQRLIILLGHPTYSLSVVLCTLLLAGGAGSYVTKPLAPHALPRAAAGRFLVLLLVVAACGVALPHLVRLVESASIPMRIVAAIGLVAPAGFCMGMAFPIGLKLAAPRVGSLTPWLWGINGATSVCGSVLAVAIALESRISTAFWTGWACYLFAFAAVAWIGWSERRRDRATAVRVAA